MIGLPKQIINWLLEQDKEKKFEIKEHTTRSLSANNYAWQLMEKIAKALRTSKEGVYEIMLGRYGTFRLDEAGSVIKVVNSNELKSTDKLHLKFMGKKTINNEVLNIYGLLKGSSEYDKKQMSEFIDGIVSEAKEMEIETLTPNEIANLKSQWGNK